MLTHRQRSPRPLTILTATEMLTWLGSYSALMTSKPDLPPLKAATSKAANQLQNLAEKRNALGPETFDAAVLAAARARLEAFQDGVRRYQAAAPPPRTPEPPAVWEQGTTRLLAFSEDEGRAPVLVIPSLVNRYHVLDFREDWSLLRDLALTDDAAKLCPYVVDWGAPGEAEIHFDLTAYVHRLGQIIRWLHKRHGRPVSLVGYCMGGLLALAAAARFADDTGPLALLATPWDFHTGVTEAERRALPTFCEALEPLLQATGTLPVEVQQTLFWARAPFLAGEKFRAFATLPAGGQRFHDFVRLEDWLNDGVPLAASVARACMAEWYGDNQPAKGRWQIDGAPVTPANVRVPCLLMIPKQDHIVPPSSALALSRQLPNTQILSLQAGHIGMVAGSAAKKRTYHPLRSWLIQTIKGAG